MSNRAGYEALSQDVDDDAEESAQLLPTLTGRRHPNGKHASSVDLRKLDQAFKRWTESIAQKVKRKKKEPDHSKRHIWRSVFEPHVPAVGTPPSILKTLDHNPPLSDAEFEAIVNSVKVAILEGIHPKMITKGSSGSYFARAKAEDGRSHTVAVFKPKDEEPYGRLNPKTTKWLHRQFRWIIPFGRACLIPNLSYISEAAASLLDNRLQMYIVPPTKLVSLSSSAFFYDWIDRNGAKKGKQLPDKIGSMQIFMNGYTDASEFLRKYPWPGRAIVDTFDDSNHRQGGITRRALGALKILCGRTGDAEDVYDDYDEERLFDASETGNSPTPFYWTNNLQQSFRDELEKLVILDYLMLNTDRGADNYMIKYCDVHHEKSLVDVAPSKSPAMGEHKNTRIPSMTAPPQFSTSGPSTLNSTPDEDYTKRPHIHIAAIDNSLSFPHEHPHGWRSYTYGWLYLPVSVIGRPFSQKTRDHFLPMLTSKTWWEETTFELEKLFAIDPDFHPKMFRRQLAVIKGQAWNIVQSLRHSNEGPLELTRRQNMLVWDDELELNEDDVDEDNEPPTPTSPRAPSIRSMSSVPLPPRRTYSSDGNALSPTRMPAPLTILRTSSERPVVPFVSKLERIHPSATGVTVLEHLERLDAAEAKSQKQTSPLEGVEEEEDLAVSRTRPRHIHIPSRSANVSGSSSGAASSPGAALSPTNGPLSPMSVPASPLPTLHETVEAPSLEDSMTEEDLVSMSRSTSHVEPGAAHSRWASQVARNMDWMQPDADVGKAKKIVIAERLEPVEHKPTFACW
ncbi:hypothetical protein CYLTODRAFT_364402 [Cylindrobasidium torrendii FP15055 ss-10]|uniref:Phosphatidylinositol 4-kinase n=1 Tax=Cylindrobasidium torrendii FP15055 ss-10 TaxID=1314674 RepID=A0A0D7BV02_9AGAR|nr:hypothetical protein CYLTODRAFT_364402 [Cylindrobasidium torrendii FP15055 ss-10]